LLSEPQVHFHDLDPGSYPTRIETERR